MALDAWPDVPTRYLLCRDDRLFPAVLDGVGHADTRRDLHHGFSVLGVAGRAEVGVRRMDQESPEDEGHDHAHAHRVGGWRGTVSRLFHAYSHDGDGSLSSELDGAGRGIRALRISFAGLMVTAVLQLVVVMRTGSVALLADTIHNFSDALTAVPLFMAFRLARRPANRRYTFGYRRAEDLAGVLVVALIAMSAAVAVREAVARLLEPRPVTNLGWLLAAGLIGFVGNELAALYRIREGRAIGSAALIADGYHARSDGLTSLAVAGGAVGVWLGFPQADAIAGLIIFAAILVTLWSAGRQVHRRLMDAVDPELVEQVEHLTERVPGVEAVGSVRVRWNGHRLRAALAIVVDRNLTVASGHAIAEHVRHELLHRVRHLEAVSVHVDPCAHDGTDPHAALAHHPDPLSQAMAAP